MPDASGSPEATTVIVLAKAPVAGKVKTRLCPPFTAAEAASIASAALTDTLEVVLLSRSERVVLALDGALTDCSECAQAAVRAAGPRCLVLAQCEGGLDRRIASAFAATDSATVLVGMDTPQITPPAIDRALDTLRTHDAVLGPSADGGFWLVGVNDGRADVFRGVPMSTDETGAAQLARLRSKGMSVAIVETLIDVDDIDAAIAVALQCPGTEYARRFETLRGWRRAVLV